MPAKYRLTLTAESARAEMRIAIPGENFASLLI